MDGDSTYVRNSTDQALTEDVGPGDVTVAAANVRAYAVTGADYLSAGTLTHSAPGADLSLLVDGIQ